MKKIKILFPVLIMGILMCFSSAVTAFAATTTQDGLEVTLSSDKKMYAQKDTITATLTVTNTNDYEVFNVVLEEYIPTGYILSEGSTLTKSLDKLEANEQISLSVIFSPDNSSVGENETTTITSSDKNANSTTTLSSSKTTASSGTSSNNTSNNNNNASNSANTGDDTNVLILIITLVACIGIAIGCVFMKKKTRNTMLSLLLCVTVAKAFVGVISANAADSIPKSISISETVNVENNSIIINAVVKYDMKDQGTISPADEYYENTSEKIISTEYASAENTFSEAEAAALLAERHFDQYPIICEYDLNGTYTEETEIDKQSNMKHPMYQTMYVAEEGDVWSIFIIGKTIYACPLSYNYESDTEVEYIFGETDVLVCYADDNNKFYTTIPKNTVISYHVIETVNAEALDKFTYEEVDKL